MLEALYSICSVLSTLFFFSWVSFSRAIGALSMDLFHNCLRSHFMEFINLSAFHPLVTYFPGNNNNLFLLTVRWPHCASRWSGRRSQCCSHSVLVCVCEACVAQLSMKVNGLAFKCCPLASVVRLCPCTPASHHPPPSLFLSLWLVVQFHVTHLVFGNWFLTFEGLARILQIFYKYWHWANTSNNKLHAYA